MVKERVANPKPTSEDKELDNKLRPASWQDFAGQGKIKEQLSIFIKAAKDRGEALDHILFYGPPGLGKTTLANIVSRELGVNINSTSGPVIERPVANLILSPFRSRPALCCKLFLQMTDEVCSF